MRAGGSCGPAWPAAQSCLIFASENMSPDLELSIVIAVHLYIAWFAVSIVDGSLAEWIGRADSPEGHVWPSKLCNVAQHQLEVL